MADAASTADLGFLPDAGNENGNEQTRPNSTDGRTADSDNDEWLELGIDYGTSHIKIFSAFVKNKQRDGTALPVRIGMGTEPHMVSSAVAYHNGEFYWGHDLQAKIGREIPVEKVIRCPKLALYYRRGEHQDVDHMYHLLDAEHKTTTDLLNDHITQIIKSTRDSLQVASMRNITFDPTFWQRVKIRARFGVPAIWTPEACTQMQIAAQAAGLVVCRVAPEPVCAWASCIEWLLSQTLNSPVGGKVDIEDGQVFGVLDLGAATVDPVLMRLNGEFGEDARFEILPASSGSIGSSEQVNEGILSRVIETVEQDPFKWPNGIAGEIERLELSMAEFRYQVLQQADTEKLRWRDPRTTTHRIVVEGKGGYFMLQLDERVIEQALREVIQGAINQAEHMVNQMTEGSEGSGKVLLLTGGFSANILLQELMEEHFAPLHVRVIPLTEMHRGRPLLVAEGAVSPYYDSIEGSKCLLAHNYYLLNDERFDKWEHPDCMIERKKDGRLRQYPVVNYERVGRYYDFTMPTGKRRWEERDLMEKEDRNNPYIAPSRLLKVLSKNEVATDKKTTEVQAYDVRVSDGLITVPIVYSDTDYGDHACALADGYNIAADDQPLKSDIHPLCTVTARLDVARMLKWGGFRRYTDREGVDRLDVHANLVFEYQMERDLHVSFELLPTNRKRLLDDKRPLRVPGTFDIWKSTHSALWQS